MCHLILPSRRVEGGVKEGKGRVNPHSATLGPTITTLSLNEKIRQLRLHETVYFTIWKRLQCQYFDADTGDCHCVLELCRPGVVERDDSPTIVEKLDARRSFGDAGLHGEYHALNEKKNICE